MSYSNSQDLAACIWTLRCCAFVALLYFAVGFDAMSRGLPGVVGAIDGTHVQMLRPRQTRMASGSRKTHWYEYKHKHTVHVLTIANPEVSHPHLCRVGGKVIHDILFDTRSN